LLTGPHPEYACFSFMVYSQLTIYIRFAAVNLDPKSDGPDYPKLVQAVAQDDALRVDFLKACLTKLGLIISQDQPLVPSLSRLHLSSQNHFLVGEMLSSWEDIITVHDGEEYIKGENDTFHFEKQESRWFMKDLKKSLKSPVSSGSAPEHVSDSDSEDGIIDYNKITKRIITHEENWPGTKETPYFNHHSYYANLKKYQHESGGEAEIFGKSILYGEVVTSTNTILEKYGLFTILHCGSANRFAEIQNYYLFFPMVSLLRQQPK
jgi:biotin--protein ligase